MLSINNLCKKYDNKIIINDLNLSFSSQGIYRIVGRNGKGKSTLLKIIAGVEKPNQGQVLWNDQYFYKKAGYIFDTPLYIEELSFKENLEFLAEVQGLNKSILQHRISYLADIFHFSLDSIPIKKYSSGMKKKVEIAMSILNNPKYLIWDEPFNNLDKESITLINREIISKEILLIIVTHNEEYIESEYINIEF